MKVVQNAEFLWGSGRMHYTRPINTQRCLNLVMSSQIVNLVEFGECRDVPFPYQTIAISMKTFKIYQKKKSRTCIQCYDSTMKSEIRSCFTWSFENI